MARKRRSKEETRKVDALIERLREFVRFNYITAGEVAREIGVHDSSVYSWLLVQARPAEPKRISAFLDSFPRQNGSGIAPVGYEYREYKHWRGIPKPRRCPNLSLIKTSFPFIQEYFEQGRVYLGRG
ncbi:MAG: hypothetical protein JO077_07690 [Verrucomicrobia bacterium]|nr:hypothetical protein [Verrucomicrobiota bacterium]